ncbi:MAG: hypothetical protein NTX88_11820 [Candidatus Atribacteria bacterium]|nr:hypothetical protein [Candidatus Atribacteria bacterium]
MLNQDLIDHDARFDGYQGIETSEKNLSPQEVIQAYHTLGTIEESSRIMKSTLEVRPIFPWTPRRIRGHFAVCFLAFLLERILERSLQGAGIPASPETIRETLNSLQVAKVDIDHQPYYLKMKGNPPRSKDPSTP